MQVHQSESSSRVRVIWLLRHLGLSLFSHEVFAFCRDPPVQLERK